MHETRMDSFDRALLDALQRDGSMTNAELASQVGLSASQCSRRRASLEAAGLIEGYVARLNAVKLGFGVRAMARVNLNNHGRQSDAEFARFLQSCPQVTSAFSVTGDADYILDIRMPDLVGFAEFIHTRLLPHPLVAQVRSEMVLKIHKDGGALDLRMV